MTASDVRGLATVKHLSSPWRRSLIVSALVVNDTWVIILTSQVAIQLRTRMPILGGAPDVAALVNPLVAAIVVGWLFMIHLAGGYRHQHVGAGTTEYRAVVRGSLMTAGLLAASAYLFQYPLSRAFYFLFFVVGIPALVGTRYLVRKTLHWMRRHGYLRVPMLIVGDRVHVNELNRVMRRERWVGYDLVGALTYDRDEGAFDVPVMGTPDDVVLATRQSRVDAVVFTEGSFRRPHHFNQLARELEQEDAQLIVIPSLTEIASERVNLHAVAGVPLLRIAKPQAERAGRGLKRVFDLSASVVLLLLLSPILLLTAIAVKAGDGGPILFRQPRVGRRGQPFNCLKFRSMVVGADEVQESLPAENDGAGPLFKMKNDPRVTTVGRFIRRYSIDELPQLWNVVRGDMSLVGPRPALQREVDQYKAHVVRRLDVRPGITGLWQVSGRSNLSWDDTVRLDLYYVDNWSFVQDLAILGKTVSAVFRSDGAY